MIKTSILEHIETINLLNQFAPKIETFAQKLITLFGKNKKLIICGNGGSAADAQHLASELVGKYEKFRKSFAALSLSTDSSALTSIGNDYGFDTIFSRQIEGLGQAGDILLVISTSGLSMNLIKAVESAKKKSIETIGLLGKNGGNLKNLVDFDITVPNNKTCRIQEAHGLLIHIICQLIEDHIV